MLSLSKFSNGFHASCDMIELNRGGYLWDETLEAEIDFARVVGLLWLMYNGKSR
jgi:hypothetical protein